MLSGSLCLVLTDMAVLGHILFQDNCWLHDHLQLDPAVQMY